MSAFALSIVVPAYRGLHLKTALASLVAQTNRHFSLHVCDDGSSDDLAAIFHACLADAPSLESTFHRFERNLGCQSLVASWQRAVDTTDTPWVWLFSDDDIADPQCVEKFYHALQADELSGNVCRFNTATIDKDGEVIIIHAPHPASESAAAFAYHRLIFQRRSFAPEYIFRRSAYTANHGFVDFPFALGSDDASWIAFAGDTPIVTLPDALVYWRLSGSNTSVLDRVTGGKKIVAMALFSRWMGLRFRGVSPLPATSTLHTRIDMEQLARYWLIQSVRILSPSFGYGRALGLAGELQQQGFGSKIGWSLRLWRAMFYSQLTLAASILKRFVKWG